MHMIDAAPAVEGWIRVADDYPAIGDVVEVLHFGGYPEIYQIRGVADVNKWGICPRAKDGGHGMRSTVTHWRRVGSNTKETP